MLVTLLLLVCGYAGCACSLETRATSFRHALVGARRRPMQLAAPFLGAGTPAALTAEQRLSLVPPQPQPRDELVRQLAAVPLKRDSLLVAR